MTLLQQNEMQEFAEFLAEAQRKTFAGGQENEGPAGSTISTYSAGRYSLTDIWFGSKYFAGQQVARYARTQTPIWTNVYYGRDLNTEIMNSGGNDFLKLALRNAPVEFPVRGPRDFRDARYPDYIYMNQWYGNLELFQGLDEIFHGIKLAFQLNYLGGFVQK